VKARRLKSLRHCPRGDSSLSPYRHQPSTNQRAPASYSTHKRSSRPHRTPLEMLASTYFVLTPMTPFASYTPHLAFLRQFSLRLEMWRLSAKFFNNSSPCGDCALGFFMDLLVVPMQFEHSQTNIIYVETIQYAAFITNKAHRSSRYTFTNASYAGLDFTY
jgi:hypothetical protein